MARLSDEALLALLDLAFEEVCRRPLSDFVDPSRVLEALDAVGEPSRLSHWQTRLVVPLRERLLERARASTLTLGAWLPEDVAQALGELLGAPVKLPRAVIDELVASEQVRDNIRAMLQESLTSFVAKATAAMQGGGSATGSTGLRDALGWGARKVAAAGKGLLAGMTEELQKQLQDRVRDFVDGSVSVVQARIAERLASDETARALGRRRRKAFDALVRRREADVAKHAERFPHATFEPFVPRIVAHNLAREEVRATIRDEVSAVLTELSTETVGSLLDASGTRSLARESLRQHGLPVARALVESSGFEAWWERWVAPAPEPAAEGAA